MTDLLFLFCFYSTAQIQLEWHHARTNTLPVRAKAGLLGIAMYSLWLHPPSLTQPRIGDVLILPILYYK